MTTPMIPSIIPFIGANMPGAAFAARAVDVIDSIVITAETNPNIVYAQWIAYDPDITVYSNLRSTQAVRLYLNWSDQNGTVDLVEGDYFTFVIPDIFIYELVHNVTNADIRNENGDLVATYSIYDNSDNRKEVRITFTDFVNTNSNISGDFWALLFVGSVSSTEQKNLEFVVNGDLAAEGEVTINPGNPYTPRNSKVGFSAPTQSAGGYYIFEWLVYINMGENASTGFNRLEGFSFEDILPQNSPQAFLTDEIRQELGIPQNAYQAQIGEYTGADLVSQENRYQAFIAQYNSTGANIWYNFINWYPLVNGLATGGIDSGSGLDVSDIVISDKSFTANLGTLTRPTAIRFYSIATVKMAESALGDSEVAKLFTNSFHGNYGENLNATLTVYRFEAGGTAQGISGAYSFSFRKVNEYGASLPGAMFSLFTSLVFTVGADRFAFSSADGTVLFSSLPSGTYYFQESTPPGGYQANSKIYRVVINSAGYEIYFGEFFEYRLSDFNNEIIDVPEGGTLPVSVTLTATKNLTGQTLENGMFSFVVKDEGGFISATGTNDSSGGIAFSSIAFSAPGVYAFTVEELRGSASGIIYDGTIFSVAVTVTNIRDGNLSAEVAYPTGGIVFNNRFETEITPVSVILTGIKRLTGKSLESGMFSFAVKDEGGNIAAAGTNDAGGGIVFSSIAFDAPGVYSFTVEELRGSIGGITYDGTIFNVTVTVINIEDGNLSAEVAYPTGGIVFNNSYTVTREKECCCRVRTTKCIRPTARCISSPGKPRQCCVRATACHTQ